MIAKVKCIAFIHSSWFQSGLYGYTYSDISVTLTHITNEIQAATINQYNVLMIHIATDFNQSESQMIKFLLPPTLLSLHLPVTLQKIYIYDNDNYISVDKHRQSEISASKSERFRFSLHLINVSMNPHPKGSFLQTTRNLCFKKKINLIMKEPTLILLVT